MLTAVEHRFDGMKVEHETVFGEAHERRHLRHVAQMMQDCFVLEEQAMRLGLNAGKQHGVVLVAEAAGVVLVIV
ncbi:hypothetical protein [Candidatus Burkholderia verschuerenii]|uniref:hypothetical protein n=1 Tax=Candidatus Burkholderia verschuerenii TaxID=242163 RepID=UPI00067CD009|nr:hypothetical protein [Candidatus Burkholderia verschuerenii]